MNRKRSLAERIGKENRDEDIQFFELITLRDDENVPKNVEIHECLKPVKKKQTIQDYFKERELQLQSQPIKSEKTRQEAQRKDAEVQPKDTNVQQNTDAQQNNKNVRKRRQKRILHELLHQKLSKHFAIKTSDFRQFVKSIMDEKFPDYLIEFNAVQALQHESELMITKMMHLAYRLTQHANRVTLELRDLRELKTILDLNNEAAPHFDFYCLTVSWPHALLIEQMQSGIFNAFL